MVGRDIAKRTLRRVFEGAQLVGLDVLPRHFYSGVPDIRELRRTTNWRVPRTFDAVLGSEIDDQEREFRDCFTDEIRERLSRMDVYEAACAANGAPGFGPIEAVALYAYTARHRPERVVQIGAGVSTAVMLKAAADSGFPLEVTCVDPYPTAFLVDLAKRQRITLRQEPAQDIPVDDLVGLEAGELLFVDSTHTVRPGSEVNRVILEVLPRLKPGVVAHFHDITFPYDFSPDLLDAALFFPNETALLLAYLVDNHRCRIQFSMSMLHHLAPSAIGQEIATYRPATHAGGLVMHHGDFPSSLYLVRV